MINYLYSVLCKGILILFLYWRGNVMGIVREMEMMRVDVINLKRFNYYFGGVNWV